MRNSNRGVTLIELMIVVVIVGILAAIAYPSYRQQVMRSSRADGKTILMDRAQALEKCFTRYGVYNNGNCQAFTGSPFMSEQRRYQVTVAVNNATPTRFTLTATPQGAQAGDAECGSFTLNEVNQRGITGTGTVQRCW